MIDNEFLLMDRIQKIQQVMGKYGEDNFYMSFSGGKDSCVMSALFDEALPGNKIPRVYANTGIELNMMVEFVKRERERRANTDYRAKCTDSENVGGRGVSVQEQDA